MEQVRTKAALRGLRGGWDGTVALVPTMGYLHEGHLSLIRHARAQADRVIVTIFVNPSQFGPGEDLATYPRSLRRDLDLARGAGVDAVFTPDAAEMYHPDSQTHVEVAGLSRMLMGRLRPGHFRGVATVVTKLANIAQPDVACFGMKDYQQLAVLRRMVRDLDSPVRIDGVATLREPDGLAMSSRNVRLTAGDRRAAPVLHRALQAAVQAAAGGAGLPALRAVLRRIIGAETRADLRALDIRDADTLAPVRGRARAVVILLAVRFGTVLLIDNAVVPPQP